LLSPKHSMSPVSDPRLAAPSIIDAPVGLTTPRGAPTGQAVPRNQPPPAPKLTATYNALLCLATSFI
jgi:hypothetical protein